MSDEVVTYKVQLMGPSTLLYSDTAPEETTLRLTQKALAELRPEVNWDCAGTVLYLSADMPARVQSIVDRERPDLVLLRLPDMQLLQDYVVYRIRERWPGVYRSSIRLSRWLIDLAGGGPQGAPWFRGWIFRSPRWLLARVIGVAPAMRVDDAVQGVRETLDMLGRSEDIQLLYCMPTPTVPPNIPAKEAQRRRSAFTSAVSRYCTDKRIPWLDPQSVRDKAGIVRRLTADRWHPDLENRRFDAWILAHAISQAHDGITSLEFPCAIMPAAE